MTNKTKSRSVSKMSAAELREAGVPYFVDPAQLTMLGFDPAKYFRTMGSGGGYMLDRVKDVDLIYRLSTMHDRPMSSSRN